MWSLLLRTVWMPQRQCFQILGTQGNSRENTNSSRTKSEGYRGSGKHQKVSSGDSSPPFLEGLAIFNCEFIAYNPFPVLWGSDGPSVGCRRDGLTGTVYL